MMEDLGIASLAARAPQSLSAGEKARTLLAAALAGRPRCLLLDQSLAHLDPGSRRELEGKVVREAIASGGVVVRTHQESDPPFPGEALHVVEGGLLRPLAQLTPRAVLDESRAPFPLALRVSALLASMGRWSGPLAADASELGRALGVDPRLPSRPAPAAPSRSTTQPGQSAALIMSGVAWTPPGRRAAPILDAVHLTVGKGRIAALLGRSGSGKSTLLKLAAGILTPVRGSIQRPAPSVPRVRAVALALEYPERQLFGRTVLEDVAALLWVDGIPAEERARSARRAMTEVGLSPERFASRFPITLSEGEKRRAALAGVLVEPPQLLLLDEPTAGLDPEGKRDLAQVLDRLRERERTVLLASHDLPFVAAVADHVFLLSREEDGPGQILAEGDTATILRDEALLARAGLPVPDFVRLERILREAGLLGAASASNESSLLDALTRGGSVQPT
jgi:energy-coupling factor transport system ATP-binding protein